MWSELTCVWIMLPSGSADVPSNFESSDRKFTSHPLRAIGTFHPKFLLNKHIPVWVCALFYCGYPQWKGEDVPDLVSEMLAVHIDTGTIPTVASSVDE